MLRDKNLIPLSHQHQHVLALCVRIDRASPISEADLPAWQREITQLFHNEIAVHFTAEEQTVFPVASEFRELAALVSDLVAEHVELRAAFAQVEARTLSSGELCSLARTLSNHIRKEERQLFEMLQQVLSSEQLRVIGKKLDLALKAATAACVMPSDATRLRPAKENSPHKTRGHTEEHR